MTIRKGIWAGMIGNVQSNGLRCLTVACIAAVLSISNAVAVQAANATSTKEPFDNTVEARALVTTRDRAVLSSELTARISQMPKRPGASFSKGEVLVVFDCAAYRAQRAAVAEEVRQAEAQYKAQQRLAELKSVGKLDVTMAKAAFDRASAQLDLQEVYLSRCKIKAPYDGAVVDWKSQPYQTANSGDELIEIVGSGNLELELIVPSQWLTWLKIGQVLKARIDETDSGVTAKIARLGAQIDAVSQTVKIYASITKGASALLPGMSGRALLNAPENLEKANDAGRDPDRM